MDELPYFCGKDCGGDACPLLAEIENGRVIGMRHNPAAGRWIRACGKGMREGQVHHSPHRILTPLIRNGPRGSGSFKQASWDEALSLIAERLGEINARGAKTLCISSAGATGAVHNTEVLSRRFFNCVGGGVFVSGSYSNNAAHYALSRMFGGSLGESGFDAETIAWSNLIVLWGANPLEARLGAELPARLVEAARRKVRIIVIDPRNSPSARALGAEWVAIKPATDSVLAYAILHEMLHHPDFDMEYVQKRADGFEKLAAFVEGQNDGVPKSPQWAEYICGVPAGSIRSLAALWFEARPVMLIPGYSIQRTRYGEEPFRLMAALQLASRNSGLRGASTGSLNNRLPGVRVAKMPDLSDRANTPSVPVLRWPDAVLEPERHGTGPIEAIYAAGSNFLIQGADVRKNMRAFERVSFSVCHELFLTPTARWSDVVLPAADAFEKADIGIPWAGRYVLYRPRIFEPRGLARSDYSIFAELAERMGAVDRFSEGKSEDEWLEQFIRASEIPDPEEFRKTGIYIAGGEPRAGLEGFFSDPERNPLATATGRIIFESPLWEKSPPWTEELGPKEPSSAPGRKEEAPEDPVFQLLTCKVSRFVHSQRGAWPESTRGARIHMNPEDMRQLGLQDRQAIELRNARGNLQGRTHADSGLRQGVLWTEEGLWDPPVNILTDTEGTAESASCIMHGIEVRLRPIPQESSGHS